MTVLRRLLLVLALFTLAGAVGCAGHRSAGTGGGEKNDVIYTCACGPQCHCGSVSLNPGKCTCGKELTPGHVLKVEGTEALVCQCGKDCSCQLDPKDSSKCGCGKQVKRVDLAGKDVYFCNCMGSCTCNNLSDMPGKCRCGMNLKKAE